jgi:AraC-like DNA-binding protein
MIKTLIIDIIRIHSECKDEVKSKIDSCSLTQVVPAIDYVDGNYSRNIRAKELAFICGMSETHFRRIFEENIKMTPMEYVNLVRIQKACELMTKTNYSMDVIAAECGYQTTSTFNRNFKKYLDTSPYQWKINPNNYTSKLKNFRISALKGW